MIPDSLFSPPQSPCFSLLKAIVLSCSESLFRPLRFPFSSSSKSRVHPLPSSSSNSRAPPLRFPFPSSPSSSLLSKSSPILFLLAAKKTAERHEAVPPFLVCVFVPKWNMILSLLVRPQSAVARLEHLEAIVPVSQLLPGLAANVMVHSNVKHAVIARPAAAE